MTGKEYLWRARKLTVEIREWEERLREELDAAGSISVSSPPFSNDGTASGGSHWASFESKVDRSVDSTARIRKILRKKRRELDQILLMIQKLDRAEYVSLLTNRYVKGLQWRSVTAAMEKDGFYYSEGYVKIRLHKDALKAFDAAFQKM